MLTQRYSEDLGMNLASQINFQPLLIHSYESDEFNSLDVTHKRICIMQEKSYIT